MMMVGMYTHGILKAPNRLCVFCAYVCVKLEWFFQAMREEKSSSDRANL